MERRRIKSNKQETELSGSDMKSRQWTRLTGAGTLLCLAILSSSGCSTWMKDRRGSLFAKDEKPAAPTKIVAMWTDTVLYQPGIAPRRGFGGRLMFYDNQNKDPIKVEGALIVYAFVEDGRDPDKVRPDRKFVFTPEQLADRYSKSSLGHSYSIWLPWDDVGNPQVEISLIVRFEPVAGAVVVSEQTRHVLPGPPAAVAENNAKTVSGGPTPASDHAGSVRAANYQSPQAAESAHATNQPMQSPGGGSTPAARKLQTTTINIPSNPARTRNTNTVGTINASAYGAGYAPATDGQQMPPGAFGQAMPGSAGFPNQGPAAFAAPGTPGGVMPGTAAYGTAAMPGPSGGVLPPANAAVASGAISGPQYPAPASQASSVPTMTTEPQADPRQRTPLSRSALSRPRVLAGPVVQPTRDRAPWRQYPSAPAIHPSPEQLVPESMRGPAESR